MKPITGDLYVSLNSESLPSYVYVVLETSDDNLHQLLMCDVNSDMYWNNKYFVDLTGRYERLIWRKAEQNEDR